MADPKYVKMRVVTYVGWGHDVGEIVSVYWCQECCAYHEENGYYSFPKESLVPAFEFENEEE